MGRLPGYRFPKTQDQPPIAAVFENPDPKAIQVPGFRFVGAPPLPRCWFLNASETELIQVQNDKFVRNWRKVTGADVYPRYETIRESFASDLGAFERFVRQESLGETNPVQCEVTYVNHVPAGSNWNRHGELHKIVNFLAADGAKRWSFLCDPEDVRFALRFVVTDKDGQFLGRLNVDVQPAFLTDSEVPIFVLTLTARGRPIGAGTDGVLAFLDSGREWIVRGFADLTTTEMHQIWKRRS